jgi:uncharacterized protein (TIGR03435 family)
MHDATDMDLLRQYAVGNSDAAFAALVSRHVDLVYSAALRKTGNLHAAEEITQVVFIILAQKAGRILDKTILPGWLYQTARLTASSFLRRETRRVRREQEAYMQNEPYTVAPEATWEQLAPLLEDAMGQLGDKDRAAVVLRFFGGKSFAEVATAAGVSENAAKKRVIHALGKLHRYFARRGVSSTTAIIAGAISANSVKAAPVALAKAVTAVAVAKGAAASGSTLTLIKGALKIMAWTKAKTAIVVGASVLLAAGTATVTVKEIQEHRTYSWQVEHINTGMLDREPPQVRIIPTKFPQARSWGSDNGKFLGIGQPVEGILEAIYDLSPARMVLPAGLPQKKYDFIANLPHGSAEALQLELKKKCGVVARLETREMDVLRLRVKNPNARGLRSSTTQNGSSHKQAGHYSCINQHLSNLTRVLDRYFEIPVIDQTALNGRFDIDLKWNEQNEHGHNPDALKQALLDQLGLELVPGREPVEMLVVEKVE